MKEFLAKLEASKSEQEWNAICAEVKAYAETLPDNERSGDYPSWWFRAVILSGLMARAVVNWRLR